MTSRYYNFYQAYYDVIVSEDTPNNIVGFNGQRWVNLTTGAIWFKHNADVWIKQASGGAKGDTGPHTDWRNRSYCSWWSQR